MMRETVERATRNATGSFGEGQAAPSVLAVNPNRPSPPPQRNDICVTVSVSKLSLEVAIPTTGSGPQGPTGQVNNSTSSFLVNGTQNPATFIFANLNGTISAWNSNLGAIGTIPARVEATTPGAVYTGLAIGSNASGPLLYAANGRRIASTSSAGPSLL